MPTLEFLSLQEERDRYPPITKYGYQSDFFDEIEELFDSLEMEDPEVDVGDGDKIAARLLRTGPCPGSARVYHTFASSPTFDNQDERIKEMLGVEVETTRRVAGREFEEWIDTANKGLNSWLNGEGDDEIRTADIPERLKEFYLDQLDKIETKCENLGIELPELEMDVQLEVTSPLFHESTPDGAWTSLSNLPGGVFESKLSLPPEPINRYVLAGYAAHIERSQEIPIDFGVFLMLDEEEEQIELHTFFIDDVLRESIKENLEIFASLAFDSITDGEWNEDEPLSNRLIEPDEPKYDNVCSNCLYQDNCHFEGKYERLFVNSYDDISNLKLSGNQIPPVLQAVKRGEPDREAVGDAVMEHFPDKSKKSVFRGMVLPTTKRLHLVRTTQGGKSVTLSPNGKMLFAVDDDDLEDRIGMCIRDYIVDELGYTQNAINYAEDTMESLAKRMNSVAVSSDRDFANIGENISRLNSSFVDYFNLDLPDEDSLLRGQIEFLYPDSNYRDLLNDNDQRQAVLDSALPNNQQIQIEQARWRIIQCISDQEGAVTSWFADELLWRERNYEDSSISLWEGSVHERTKLIREGVAYDGVLKEN